MIVKLLTEHHLEFLNLKGGCRGLSETILVKMSNCWKSYATAHLSLCPIFAFLICECYARARFVLLIVWVYACDCKITFACFLLV